MDGKFKSVVDRMHHGCLTEDTLAIDADFREVEEGLIKMSTTLGIKDSDHSHLAFMLYEAFRLGRGSIHK